MTEKTEPLMPDGIEHGLYRIFWVDGDNSLASVGSTYDGTRWYAPCNWTTDSKNNPAVASTDWVKVDRIELILADADLARPAGDHSAELLRPKARIDALESLVTAATGRIARIKDLTTERKDRD